MKRPTVQDQRERLEHDGYVEVPEHRGLAPGVRISHRGHQWRDALLYGSATVVAVYERPNSPWSSTWGRPDVEVIYQADREPEGRCPITWADYHCSIAPQQTRDETP